MQCAKSNMTIAKEDSGCGSESQLETVPTTRTKATSVPDVSEERMAPDTSPAVLSEALFNQLKTQIEQLQADNRLLKRQLTESIDSNNKWLSYDSKRDAMVNSLLSNNKALQAKLAQKTPSDLSQTNLVEEAERWRAIAEEEIELRQYAESVNHRQQLFIDQLQGALQTAQESAPSSSLKDYSSLEKARERIILLENQVQVISEDFEEERRDRERAQSRISELESELLLVREQHAQFQGDHMAYLAMRRERSADLYRQEYQRQLFLQQNQQQPEDVTGTYSSPSRSRLIPHGHVECDAPYDEDENDEDELDIQLSCTTRGQTNCRSLSPSRSSSSVSTNSSYASMLECPKCHQKFPVDDPLTFLEHNDQC